MKNYFIICILILCCLNIHADQLIEATLQQLNEQHIQFIDCKTTDIHGNLKLITIPITFAKSAFARGLNFDGSSILGCTSINNSDLLLMPDLNTVHNTPWLEGSKKTAGIFCTMRIDQQTPYACPRTILKGVLDEAHQMGFEFLVGPELEFFIMDSAGTPCDQKEYFDSCTRIDLLKVQRSMLSALAAQGVRAEKLHHEVAPGQHEISIKYGNALAIADQIVIAKHTIKTIANIHNLNATFMPKPLYEENGSAMHIHFSLWDTTHNCNAFYDADHPAKLSETARYFLAGILHHIKELNLIFNPTINSYKRLVPCYEAPIYICWGTKNRSAMIRIPEVGQDEPYAVRAEIRSPDASCNPYLACAALLKAGLEGIKNKYALPAPAEKNMYHLGAQEIKDAQIDLLPQSLQEAVALFAQSALAHDLFGERLCNELIKIKTQEAHSFATTITDWELQKYF